MKLMKMALLSGCLALAVSTVAHAHGTEEHWVCIKKNKEIPTKGKNDKAKAADCAKQKGQWTKHESETPEGEAGSGTESSK